MRRGGSCRPFSCQTRRFLGGFLGLPPEQPSDDGVDAPAPFWRHVRDALVCSKETSLSSLLLLGVHPIGGSTDVPLLRVRVVACSAKPLLTIPLAKCTGWSKKGDGPRYAQCARAVSGPQPPPLWTRRWMNAYITYPWKKFPNGLAKRSYREYAACKRGPAGTPRNRG